MLVTIRGETTVPRAFRPLTLLLIFTFVLALAQPSLARASTLPFVASAESVSQTSGRTQPGPIVRQAFDLLMDRFVIPPKSGSLLNGGLDSAHFFLEKRNVADPLAERPEFTGDRREDWRLFLPAYEKVARALGNKAPREELDRAMVDGMAQSLHEAHTYFMPPEIFSQQMAELQNRSRYAGVGIQMSPDLIITDVFEGSPAEAAGLQIGDQLIAVNGESIEGLNSAETSTKVRGEAGTPVTLTLKRQGVAEPVVKTMTRATISIEWLRAKILDGGIGYLQIRQFAIPDALPLFNKAMDRFADANIKALIIDVRNNPGGSVATGEEILSRLLPDDKPLYRQVERRSGERTVSTWGDYWGRDIPIAVLANGGSGSMSEIMAAALQENGAARVIGTKTAGAVAAGVPVPLADGSGLLVTVQTITTPSGKVINEVGLEPDQTVELDPALFRVGKDTQLEAAVGYAREQAAARSSRQGLVMPEPAAVH
jgi:carboxyl-terminal processing protease